MNVQDSWPVTLTHPWLVVEWDVVNDLSPDRVTHGSASYVTWVCQTCGNGWSAQVNSRTRGAGCPECAHEKRVATAAKKDPISVTHPEIAATLVWADGATVNTLTAGSTRKVWWECPVCACVWAARVDARTGRGNGCPVCAGKVAQPGMTDLATLFPDVAAEWDRTPGKNTTTPEWVRPGSERKVWWVCRTCGHPWQAQVRNRTGGGRPDRATGCPECSKLARAREGGRFASRRSG